jgi:hypothetical protein
MNKKQRDAYASEFGRIGANARAKALTPERRKQIAKKAAEARWRKKEQK